MGNFPGNAEGHIGEQEGRRVAAVFDRDVSAAVASCFRRASESWPILQGVRGSSHAAKDSLNKGACPLVYGSFRIG